jgi:hypothetical protein
VPVALSRRRARRGLSAALRLAVRPGPGQGPGRRSRHHWYIRQSLLVQRMTYLPSRKVRWPNFLCVEFYLKSQCTVHGPVHGLQLGRVQRSVIVHAEIYRQIVGFCLMIIESFLR